MDDSAHDNPIRATRMRDARPLRPWRLNARNVARNCGCSAPPPFTLRSPAAFARRRFTCSQLRRRPFPTRSSRRSAQINGQGRPAFRVGRAQGLRPADRGPRRPASRRRRSVLPRRLRRAQDPVGPGDASPCRIARSHAARLPHPLDGIGPCTALVLLLVVAACAGGFVLFRTIWKDRAPVPTNATEAAADKGPIDDATASGPPTAAGSPKTGGTGTDASEG